MEFKSVTFQRVTGPASSPLAVAWIQCLTLANDTEEGARTNLSKVLFTEMPKSPEEPRNVSWRIEADEIQKF